MASIITATTSSGLTQSADNSGVLQLASGTGNLVTVPSVTGTAMVSGNMPAFSAYQNNPSQSISATTYTKVTLSTEEFDTANCFASNRFTPNVAGYYQINGQVTLVSGTTANRTTVFIYKNGVAYKVGVAVPFNGSNNIANSVSSLVYLNGTTDYVELYVWSGAATTLTYQAELSDSCYMNGFLARTA